MGSNSNQDAKRYAGRMLVVSCSDLRTCALQSSSTDQVLAASWSIKLQPVAGTLGSRPLPDVRSIRCSKRDRAARCGVGLPYWSGTQALCVLSMVCTLQRTSGPAAWPSTEPEWREAPTLYVRTLNVHRWCVQLGAVSNNAHSPTFHTLVRNSQKPLQYVRHSKRYADPTSTPL